LATVIISYFVTYFSCNGVIVIQTIFSIFNELNQFGNKLEFSFNANQ